MRNDKVAEARLVQVFLTPSTTLGPSINEVTADAGGVLYCTCLTFSKRKTCKHCTFVKNRIDNNDGVYPLEFSSKATEEDIEKAKATSKTFRDFIIKFGKIEVY